MTKLLRPGDNCRWNLDGIEFAIEERVGRLELNLAEARGLKQKLDILRGQHTNLKGHYYVSGGLVEGIIATEFSYTLGYHLETG